VERRAERAFVLARLPDFLYGAVRLDFLPEQHFVLYAIPLAIGWAVTVTAMLSKDPVGPSKSSSRLEYETDPEEGGFGRAADPWCPLRTGHEKTVEVQARGDHH
jgi:hypothetical protein